jgi:autotransporter-associated beta strand protein
MPMKTPVQTINATAPFRNLFARSLLRHGFFLIPLALASAGLLQSTALAETDLPHPLYTWSLNPTNNDWNTPSNWRPEGVPDTQAEKAAFGSSSVTNVTASPSDALGSLEFTPGANQYTFNGGLFFNRGGVFNNSGVVQTFNGAFGFDKGATAGSLVTYNVTTYVSFSDGGDAGNATFNLTGYGASFSGGPSAISTAGSATFNNSGTISFGKLSNAGEATFINYGGTSFGALGAEIDFRRSSASSSTIVLYGGSVFGALGARLSFDKSSASSATLIAYGGAGGVRSGASILFTNSGGNTARVEVFGNGNIDFSRREVADNTIGSLEGNGVVYLGAGTLAIGGNNINTTFAGTITEQGGVHQGGPGSISKTGTGTLTLTSPNDYSAGTTVESGSLFVNNTSGSATGSGPVSVTGGTLAGAGTITGPLTVGNGSSGATLAPGATSSTIGTLTVQDALNFASNSSYEAQLDSTALTADNVTANGVTISSDAQITLTDLGATTLPDGTSFTLIENTSGAAIGGTFSNLGDGAMIAIGSNTYQANYEGGDGNDLTLTVVP